MKRRGIALIASLAVALSLVASVAAEEDRGENLQFHPDWREFRGVWAEAVQIRSGVRGARPFTQAQKETLVEQLESAPRRLSELAVGGLLTEPEAGLLGEEAKLLAADMRAVPAVEDGGAAIARKIGFTAGSAAAEETLLARLDDLEVLAAQDEIPAPVHGRILESVHRRLAELPEPPHEKDHTRTIRKRVAARLARLPEVEPPPLLDTTEWKCFDRTWNALDDFLNDHSRLVPDRPLAEQALREVRVLVPVGSLHPAVMGALDLAWDRLMDAVERRRNPLGESRRRYTPLTVAEIERTAARLEPLLEVSEFPYSVQAKLRPLLEEFLRESKDFQLRPGDAQAQRKLVADCRARLRRILEHVERDANEE